MAHLTNFSFEFFYEIFTEDASPFLLYHGAKKVKNDQKLKSRESLDGYKYGGVTRIILFSISQHCAEQTTF